MPSRGRGALLQRADPIRVVLVTAGSLKESRQLAQLILKRRLAACVNLLPSLESWYRWQGRVTSNPEVLLLVKTSHSHLNALYALLKSHHSYQVPEFLALPVTQGAVTYLTWLKENLLEKT